MADKARAGTADEMQPYEQAAREIMYDGLEAGWVNHDAMLRTLSRALWRVDNMKAAGRIEVAA